MVEPWFEELAGFLRIPSVSADPERARDVRAAGQWVADFVEAAGGAASLRDVAGSPILDASFHASGGAEAPTVLCYGHFDVQPPAPLELWQSDPFELELRDGYLYARGAVDDKGQLYMLLAAARQLHRAGELPVNLRFLCDGEEETGGHTIVDHVAAEAPQAQAAVIFDSGMVRRGLPAFNVAMRGIVYFHLRLRSGERDLHSGLYGGAAQNVVHAFAQLLTALLPRDGRLPEPLREGLLPPSEEEVSGWLRELPPGDQELSEQGATPADPRAAEEFYLRTFAEPALDVNGVECGSPHLQKTVLPVLAEANVSIRLAPGQQPDVVAAAFERLVREAAPVGASVELTLLSSAAPGLVRSDAPAIRLGLEAFERALGTRPLLIRSGGTLPIVAALGAHGVPTVVTGFGLPDSNIHAPNERLVADYLPLGIAAAVELFRSFAAL